VGAPVGQLTHSYRRRRPVPIHGDHRASHLRLSLREEDGDDEDGRNYDETGDDAGKQLRSGDGYRTDLDLLRWLLFGGVPEEHAVRDHGKEEGRHACAQSLCAGEERLLGPVSDGQPHVILEEPLGDVPSDEDRGVWVRVAVGDGQELTRLTLGGRQPIIARKQIPMTTPSNIRRTRRGAVH